ncbi:MAG TPA: cytosine permease [Dehalococcoidia bacterium]|nr:cytosine permease [Dehalococcoidia bacterium]
MATEAAGIEIIETEEWGIRPVPESHRRLRGIDFAILWGDLAVSLLIIAAGSLLVPSLSTRDALLVIVIGNVVGAALLATAGVIGSKTGVPTMVSLRAVLGIRGSYLGSGLNILQLVGWAALEIIIMANLASGLSDHFLGFRGYYFWLAAFALLGTAMALGGPVTVVRQWMQKFGVWVVLAASVWLTLRLFDAYDFDAIWDRGGEGGLQNFFHGLDLVISLPVSWLPLVGDYSRFARRAAPAAVGTYVGYGLANIWFFALGALYVSALNTDYVGFFNGDAFVDMLVPLTLGWLALIALLAGESDEVFANIYSTAVSLRNVLPWAGHAALTIAVGGVAFALGVILDALAYEPFLLLIGGVFVPLFGIFLADFFVLRSQRYDVEQLYGSGGPYWYSGGFNVTAVAVWLAGFILYTLAAQPSWLTTHDEFDFVSWAPDTIPFIDDIGGTAPAFVFSFLAYLLVSRLLVRAPSAAQSTAGA